MREMILSKLKRAALVLSATVLLTATTHASAATITYIQSGHGTGSLNGVSFDADFAIQAIANTANVTSCGAGCLYNDNLSATITINGLGIFSFVKPTHYFSNVGIVGFSGASGDLFNGPAVTSWDMTSTIGPIIGTAQLLQWASSDVETSGGRLVFNDSITPSGFAANVAAVPLPAGAWLFGPGLIGLAGAVRRKAKVA